MPYLSIRALASPINLNIKHTFAISSALLESPIKGSTPNANNSCIIAQSPWEQTRRNQLLVSHPPLSPKIDAGRAAFLASNGRQNHKFGRKWSSKLQVQLVQKSLLWYSSTDGWKSRGDEKQLIDLDQSDLSPQHFQESFLS